MDLAGLLSRPSFDQILLLFQFFYQEVPENTDARCSSKIDMGQYPQAPTGFHVAARDAMQQGVRIAKCTGHLCHPDTLARHLEHHAQRSAPIDTPGFWKALFDPRTVKL